jgi:thiol-disulfide isomerase/thioredoxin
MENSDQIPESTNKKSKINRQDIILVILIIILLIPSVRKSISTFVVRLTLSKPSTENITNQIPLTDSDLQWEFIDSTSNVYTLKNFKDKRIFLNFWATWSAPSRAEMSSIQKLYNQTKDSVCFLLISFESPKVVYEYLAKESLRLPVYFSKTKPSGNLQFQAFPSTYILSEKNKILFKKSGAANYDTDIVKKILEPFKNTQDVR